MDAERYSAFVKAIDLESVLLDGLEATRDWAAFLRPQELDVQFQVGEGTKWEVREGRLEVTTSLVVQAAAVSEGQEGSEEPPALLIRVSFLLVYVYDGEEELASFVAGEGNREIVDAFVARNVPVNVWPYFREIIASVTMRMGLPPLILLRSSSH